MLLDFTEARNNSTLDNIAWDGSMLSFDFTTPTSGYALTLMVPASVLGGSLLSLEVNGAPSSYTSDLIKGQEYVLFNVNGLAAHVVAIYGEDTIPPVISNWRADPITDLTATILWDTDARVSYLE